MLWAPRCSQPGTPLPALRTAWALRGGLPGERGLSSTPVVCEPPRCPAHPSLSSPAPPPGPSRPARHTADATSAPAPCLPPQETRALPGPPQSPGHPCWVLTRGERFLVEGLGEEARVQGDQCPEAALQAKAPGAGSHGPGTNFRHLAAAPAQRSCWPRGCAVKQWVWVAVALDCGKCRIGAPAAGPEGHIDAPETVLLKVIDWWPGHSSLRVLSLGGPPLHSLEARAWSPTRGGPGG